MSFADFIAVVATERLREVALHWQDARRAKRMPGWRDLDPAALARQLPIVWAWKFDAAAQSFVGRLAGEDINAIFGRSMRGVPMQEYFAGRSYAAIFERHRRVVAEPCFMHGSGPVFRHLGRHGPGERIILPLADDGTHGDGVLGATVYRVAPGKADQPPVADWSTEVATFFPLE